MRAVGAPSALALAAAQVIFAGSADAQTNPLSDRPHREVDDTILVTGTRLPRAGEGSSSPLQSVERTDFLKTGVPNVEQTLNQFPQLVASFTNTSNNPGTGAATLDLRGLGSVRTLILVNGRRWIASDAGEVPEVDVNTIPAALLERVDIVTGGASAVYGSDAVTGVINFVLRDKLNGLHLETRQSITAAGDGRVSSADLSFGTAFLSGRGQLTASAGWLHQAPVLHADRRLSSVALQDGCAVPGTRDSTGASRAVNDPTCAPPNERALTAGGSFFIPGSRIVGRAFFPVAGSAALIVNPAGFRFEPDGSPRPFVPATDLFNFAPDNYLQVGLRRWSGNLLGSFTLSPSIEPYVELSYIRTHSPQQLAPVAALIGARTGTVPIARVNLANPFLSPEAARALDLSYGVDAAGNRGFTGSPASGFRINSSYGGDADGIIVFPAVIQSRLDLGPRRMENRRDARRGLVGIRGDLGEDWAFDLYYSRSRVEHAVNYLNSGSALRLQQALLAVRDPQTGRVVCLNLSGGCVPANIFGAGNLSREAADFIRTNPIDRTLIEEQVAEGIIRGQIPVLPAGSVGLAFGASWRRSGYDFTPDPELFTGDDLGFLPGTAAGGTTRVWELFTEARIPLLSGLPLVEELTAELGARRSQYDTVGGVWTWKVLAEWRPVPSLKFRGGYQRAVRAPNVRELFEQPTTGAIPVQDPCSADTGLIDQAEIRASCLRNGVPAALIGTDISSFPVATSRGNPDLDAETARTSTIGAVLEPHPALTLTGDFYDIRISRAIGSFGGGPTFLAFGCIAGGAEAASPLCASYRRDPDGSIATVDLPTANVGTLRARGIDWQLAYRLRLGDRRRIDLTLSGTRYLWNGFRPNNNLAALDCAGFFGAPCGQTIRGAATPKWKLYNTLRWTSGPTSLSLRHRWFSSTLDGRILLAEALSLPEQRLPAEGRRLEDRHYLDFAASFAVGGALNLTLGVNNLTGKRPAITGSNQVQANTDPSLYDVLGRRFFTALSARLR